MPVNHRVYARGALLGFPKTSPPPEKAHWLLNVLFALLRDNLLHRFGGDGWPLLDANGNCLDESQCFDVCVSGNDGQALTDMTLESSHLLENSSPPAGMKVGVWFHPGIAFCHFRDAAIRAGLAADGITAAYQQSFAPVSEDAIRSAIG